MMLNTDDLRYHTELGTGYSKDAQLCRAADEIDRLRGALSSIWATYLRGAEFGPVASGTLAYMAKDAIAE